MKNYVKRFTLLLFHSKNQHKNIKIDYVSLKNILFILSFKQISKYTNSVRFGTSKVSN